MKSIGGEEAENGTQSFYGAGEVDGRKAVDGRNAVQGVKTAQDDFELVDELEKRSGIPVPDAVKEIRTAPVLHEKQCEAEGMKDVVREFLLAVR